MIRLICILIPWNLFSHHEDEDIERPTSIFHSGRCKSFLVHELPLSFNIQLKYLRFIANNDLFHQSQLFI